jgi:hypothetical protein
MGHKAQVPTRWPIKMNKLITGELLGGVRKRSVAQDLMELEF